MKKSISFKLKPGNEEFEKISRKGCAFLRENGVSGDAVQTQMMILWGLIIRGKEFDSLRPANKGMTIYLLVEKKIVTVEVRKPVGESSLHNFRKLNELDKTIQLIRGGQDPLEQYRKRLQASAKFNNDNTNDFELARIAYETGADIDFYVNEDNILNLSAVRRLI